MDSTPDDQRRNESLEALHQQIVAGSAGEPADHAVVNADKAVAETFAILDDMRRQLSSAGISIESMIHVIDQPGEKKIGRFVLRSVLGRGSFGIVFCAFDPKLDREVALKVPTPAALLDQGYRRRFVFEAKAAARLAHPNIVSIHEAEDDGPLCYIAEELCRGQSLSEWIAGLSKAVEPRIAAEIIRAIADAVHHAHLSGVLHRDIKPSNILLAPAGPTGGLPFVPKLTDFGLAMQMTAFGGASTTGVCVGTLRYMAPEQASGPRAKLTPAADVYSLGAVLYELLSGVSAVDESSASGARHRIERGEIVNLPASIPSDLQRICRKCLATDPGQRYQTAADLSAALRRYLDNATPAVPNVPRKWLIVSAVLVTGLITCGIGLGWISSFPAGADASPIPLATAQGSTREEETRWLVGKLTEALHMRMDRFIERIATRLKAEPYIALALDSRKEAANPGEKNDVIMRRAMVLAQLDSLRSAFPQFFCELEPSQTIAEGIRRCDPMSIVLSIPRPENAQLVYHGPPIGSAMILNPDPLYGTIQRELRWQGSAATEGVAEPMGNPAIAPGYYSQSAFEIPPAHDPATESSECLYAILNSRAFDDQLFLQVPQRFVADTDHDGLMEYVDAWGKSLRYIRWPTDYYAFQIHARRFLDPAWKENRNASNRMLHAVPNRERDIARELDLSPLYSLEWFDPPMRWNPDDVLLRLKAEAWQLVTFRTHRLYHIPRNGEPPDLHIVESIRFGSFGIGVSRGHDVDGVGLDDLPERLPIAPLIISAGVDGRFGLYTPDPNDSQGDTRRELEQRPPMWAAFQLDYRCGRVDARYWRESLDNITVLDTEGLGGDIARREAP